MRSVLQGIGSISLVVVAILAGLGTGDGADAELYTDGPYVELDAATPEVVIAVVAHPNDAMPSDADLRLRMDVIGRGDAPLEPSGPYVEGVMLNRGGTELECSGRQCFEDLAAVRFTLVDPSQSVGVNWHFWVWDLGQAWDAAVDYDFGTAGPHIAFDRPEPPYGTAAPAERIQIHAPAGVPAGTEIRFNALTAYEAVLHEPGGIHPLTDHESVVLSPPWPCRIDACDWSVVVDGGADWQLVASTDIGWEIAIAQLEPVELSTEWIGGGSVHITADDPLAVDFLLEIDRAAFDGPDFAEGKPDVFIVFELDVAADPSTRVQADTSWHWIGTTGSYARPGAPKQYGVHPDLTCDDLACTGMASITAEIYEDGFGEPVKLAGTLSWKARANVPMYVQKHPLPEAAISLEVLP